MIWAGLLFQNTLIFDLGFNWRPRTSGDPVNLYVLGGIGAAFGDDLINTNSGHDESLLVWKAAAGIDFPVSELFCVTLEGGYTQFSPLNPTPYVKLGAALTLPNLVFF